MPRIPEPEIERLKSELSVERLVAASGIELKKSGKDWLGRCPFHEDDTASLVVTPAKNLWHCFGCGIGGGPIDWVIKRQGVSFRHAVELLREGVTPLAAEGSVKRSTVRALPPPVAFDADDQALLNQTVGYYHERLLATTEAAEYLAARGLAHSELVAHFKLGVADRTLGLRLPEKNRKAGADIRAQLQKIGLIRDSGHEHFNGSLVVPVFDEAGNVVEVYGRKLLDNLRAGTPKHLYLPTREGRSRGVFNVQALATSKEIILCEALIDALTFWCAGFRNVTAAYGIEGFTDEHVAAFKRHGTERVLIAYDRDDAGERGAAKVAEVLMAQGIECFRVQFPKGILVDSDAYLLSLCRYVERNPVAAGLVAAPAEWPWSSYAAHVGAETAEDWLDVNTLHRMLLQREPLGTADRRRAATRYAALVNDSSAMSPWAGGLRQQVFLGDEAFVERTLAHASPKALRSADIPRAQRKAPCSLAAFKTLHGDRDRALHAAYTQGGMTMTSLATESGLSVSRVSRIVAQVERVYKATGAASRAWPSRALCPMRQRCRLAKHQQQWLATTTKSAR